jgi:radical SAM superfamily enzyme YgiQ (UPF0313 family)
MYWEDKEFISRFIKENNYILDSLVDEILSDSAPVIGFSLYCTTKNLSLELAKRIKEKDSSRIVVLGGQLCFPEHTAIGLINNEAVDVVVMGEGEGAFLELIEKIQRYKNIDFCPGLVYKQNGDIINCGLRPPIMNLDSLPYPDFSDFPLYSYGNPHQLPIFSSRGCPYQCVFCSTKLFWIKYRSMSGERIFQEIIYQLKKYRDVYFFSFNDHVINADTKNLSRFCDLILEAKSRREDGVDWDKFGWRGPAVIREEMDNELIKKMKEAGCIELEYGMESGSSKVRRLMKKPPYDISIVERVIRDTHNAGIAARVNFMFGFPEETEEDFQETLDFLKRNREFFAQVHPSETFCCVDPGTYLFNHPERFGITNQHYSLFWHSVDGKNIYPERLRRHQVFCELAKSLRIPLSPGGDKITLHKEELLRQYYDYKKSTSV